MYELNNLWVQCDKNNRSGYKVSRPPKLEVAKCLYSFPFYGISIILLACCQKPVDPFVLFFCFCLPILHTFPSHCMPNKRFSTSNASRISHNWSVQLPVLCILQATTFLSSSLTTQEFKYVQFFINYHPSSWSFSISLIF